MDEQRPGDAGLWMDRDPAKVDARPEPEVRLDRAEVSRRRFLQALGISGALSVAACERLPVRHALPYLVPPEDIRPGVPVHYATTCAGCAAACGVLGTVRDGRPVKLEGHPGHPLSKGGLCAAGQAEVRGLYDAGRLRGPLLDGEPTTWAALDARVHAALARAPRNGKSIWLLSGPLSGPASRSAAMNFVAAHNARWVELDDLLDASPAQAQTYALLDGRAVVPALRLERCTLLVTFAADLLGAGPEPVAHTAAYTARRRQRAAGEAFRHLHVESTLSLTGAAADERWLATPAERRQLVLTTAAELATQDSALAELVGPPIDARPGLSPELTSKARQLADELRRAGSRALVASGSADVGEQAAVALLNRVLGAEGVTLDLAVPSTLRHVSSAAVDDLSLALAAGEVGVLVALGRNPLEELPLDGDPTAALAKAGLVVAIDDRPTATVRAAQVVAATHHALEAWADHEPRPGLLSVQQPLLRPLFATRAALESLLVWAGAATTDPRAHLRAVWGQRLGWGSDGEVELQRVLARGFAEVPGTAAATSVAPGGNLPELRRVLGSAPPIAAETLDVELTKEIGIGSGRRAYNPWLRELPEPLLKTSWVGCLRVAPQRATALGLVDGDVLEITVEGAALQMPVRITPGQHPDVIGVPVGYGLVDGDAGGAPRNAWRLARAGVESTVPPRAQVRRTGLTASVPIVQVQATTAGRPIVEEVRSADEALPRHAASAASLWPERSYTTRWEMVLDLDACTGCNACVVACQAENNLPVVGPDQMLRHRDMHWLRIDRYFSGDADAPTVLFEPMLCAQCENAPCETVCPVAATVHSTDGLNQQAYNRCVGTRYCANNCPYKVRRFNWLDYKPTDVIERLVLNPDVVVRDRGVMEKCTFCVQRIQLARIEAKRQGQPEWTVQTACQESCPAKAISFGDSQKPVSPLRALKESPRAFSVLAELGIGPSVTYLARIRPKQGGGEPR